MQQDELATLLRRTERLLREAEGAANQCLSLPPRTRGVDQEIMALAIHEALATLRTARS